MVHYRLHSNRHDRYRSPPKVAENANIQLTNPFLQQIKKQSILLRSFFSSLKASNPSILQKWKKAKWGVKNHSVNSQDFNPR